MTRYENYGETIVEKIEYEMKVTTNQHLDRFQRKSGFDAWNACHIYFGDYVMVQPSQRNRRNDQFNEKNTLLSNIREKANISKFGYKLRI